MRHGVHSEEKEASNYFRDEHLSAFRKCVNVNHRPDDDPGRRGQSYAKGLPGVDIEVLPKEAVKRSDVLTLAKNPAVDVPTVSAAIMAWGRMDQRFCKMLFEESGKEWVDVAEEIRCGGIDRIAAYDRFRELRLKKKLKGTGPAYFTKLIYFFMPRSSAKLKMGYIMDQWAGCSINLLAGREIVLMNVSKTWKIRQDSPDADLSFNVSDRNTAENYEEFCSKIDRLANSFEFTPEKVDRELVSLGGTKTECWRHHVVEHRKRFISTGIKLSVA